MDSQRVITSLASNPMQPGRVKVAINEKFAFTISRKAITAGNICEGEILTPERFRELELIAVREAAIGLLARRERSRAELVRALRRKSFAKDTIERVLTALESEGLQSDARFASAWVSSRRRLSPRGRTALNYELKEKGIGETEIRRAVGAYSEDDERDALRELIAARLPRMTAGCDDKPKVKRRLLGFLARRGFAYEDIRAVLSAHFPDWA